MVDGTNGLRGGGSGGSSTEGFDKGHSSSLGSGSGNNSSNNNSNGSGSGSGKDKNFLCPNCGNVCTQIEEFLCMFIKKSIQLNNF